MLIPVKGQAMVEVVSTGVSHLCDNSTVSGMLSKPFLSHAVQSLPKSGVLWLNALHAVTALIRVVEDWLYALDQGFEVCVVFFDTWHCSTNYKSWDLILTSYIRWIRSFLCQ